MFVVGKFGGSSSVPFRGMTQPRGWGALQLSTHFLGINWEAVLLQEVLILWDTSWVVRP
jgi:hypothetical protein